MKSHYPISLRSGSVAAGLFHSTRPKQWTKNLLLFLALVFAHTLTESELVLRAMIGFVDFCLLSSATYLINDLVDLEKDRQHPLKRFRPIAAGRVPAHLAGWTAVVLVGLGLTGSALLGPGMVMMALLYMGLTFSYSFWLKQLVIIDVMAVAAGFVVRAVAGAIVIDVPISPWLYVVTVLGALFIAIAKRRHEMILLRSAAGSHRKILEEYSIPLLDQMISVVASATVIAYSLYTFSAENLPRNHAMMLTIPFLLYGIFRYLFLAHQKNAGGSPEDVLLSDRPLLLTVLGWGLASTAILYVMR